MKTRADNPPGNSTPDYGKESTNRILAEQRALADFMEAFMRASGLPLEFSEKNGTGANCCGMKIPGFCQMIHDSHSPQLTQMCGLFNRHLEEMAVDHPYDARCFAGIHMTAVPLRDDMNKVGYLKTGHVMTKQPVAADFRKVMSILSRAGVDCLAKRVEKAWLAIPVMEPRRYEAFVDLLTAFARQISVKNPSSRETTESTDSHTMREAERYIEKHSAERLKLSDVARAVDLSTNYFCRKFHDFTGVSFTDYLSGIRVTNAARLLRESKMRINEIAYETGFNSISQFNRVFRATMGISPSTYRQSMLAGTES